MKKKALIILAVVAFSLAVIRLDGNASADTITTAAGSFSLSSSQQSTYDSWISRSGGRGDIDSVKWAAAKKATGSTGNVCALWLGPVGDSTTDKITVQIDGELRPKTVDFKYYGMCSGPSNWAIRVSVDNVNGAIDTEYVDRGSTSRYDVGTSVARSEWGGATGTVGTIKVVDFLNGAREEDNGDGTVSYIREADVYRCHSSIYQSYRRPSDYVSQLDRIQGSQGGRWYESNYPEWKETENAALSNTLSVGASPFLINYTRSSQPWPGYPSVPNSNTCSSQKVPITLTFKMKNADLGQSSVYTGGALTGTTGLVSDQETGLPEGIESVYGGDIASVVTVTKGVDTPLSFVHDVYTNKSITGKRLSWQVLRSWGSVDRVVGDDQVQNITATQRAFTDGSGELFDVTVVKPTGFGNDVTLSGEATEWEFYREGMYIGGPRNWSYNYGGGSEYAVMNDEFKVKFKKEGTYVFCENLRINNATTLTHVCAAVKVLGDDAYYGSSSVVIKDAGSALNTLGSGNTGVVGSGRATAEITVDIGKPISIDFVHNLYSDEYKGKQDAVTCPPVGDGENSECAPQAAVDDKVAWSISRDGSGFGAVVAGGSGVGENYVYFTAKNDTLNKYIGNPSYENKDATVNLVESGYAVTFSAEGDYQVCETVGISSKGVSTTACAVVHVKDNNDVGLCKDDMFAATYYEYAASNYLSGVTLVKNGVKNARLVGTYSGWKDDLTYAKPNDEIEWLDCYYPGVQKTANTDVTYVEGSHSYNGSSNYNLKSRNAAWGLFRNTFTITANETDFARDEFMRQLSASPLGVLTRNLTVGDVSVQSNYRTYGVNQTKDTGAEFSENIKAGTGVPSLRTIYQDRHTYQYWGTCGSGRNRHGCWKTGRHSNIYGRITASQYNLVSDDSRAVIPYNFDNTTDDTKIEVSKSESEPVYSGETINVSSAIVHVGVRDNSVTEAEYSTLVREARVRLAAFVVAENQLYTSSWQDGNSGSSECGLIGRNKQCAVVNSYDGMLNKSGILDGFDDGNSASTFDFVGDYSVFDASAGDYFCMTIMVYPATSATSGAEDISTDVNGDGKWHIAKPVCRIIAKKPSFEVLGGGLYTSGNIAVNHADKNNVYNFYTYPNYKLSGTFTVHYYGSWAEQSVIANGGVEELPSGAANRISTLGDGSVNVTNYVTNWNYCERLVPLSFANYSTMNDICPGDDVTGHANFRSGTINQQALVNYWGDVENGDSSSISIESDDGFVQVSSATGEDVKMYKYGGNITLNGGTVWKNQTRIVRAEGDVEITGNILYERGGYSEIAEVPKVIIYASQNIKIKCKVNEIDAILIAGETIDTCSDTERGGDGPWSATSQFVDGTINSTEPNQSYLSNQLTINGMVIAKTLNLKRTYGGGWGEHSTEAAEIINYDSSALLWGRMMSGSSESDTMTLVYQHELSPRY